MFIFLMHVRNFQWFLNSNTTYICFKPTDMQKIAYLMFIIPTNYNIYFISSYNRTHCFVDMPADSFQTTMTSHLTAKFRLEWMTMLDNIFNSFHVRSVAFHSWCKRYHAEYPRDKEVRDQHTDFKKLPKYSTYI